MIDTPHLTVMSGIILPVIYKRIKSVPKVNTHQYNFFRCFEVFATIDKIINSIVIEGNTAESVSKRFGVTKQSVNQCKNRGLAKLKKIYI